MLFYLIRGVFSLQNAFSVRARQPLNVKYGKTQQKRRHSGVFMSVPSSAHVLQTPLLERSGSREIVHERWFLNAGNQTHTCLFLASFPWHQKVFVLLIWRKIYKFNRKKKIGQIVSAWKRRSLLSPVSSEMKSGKVPSHLVESGVMKPRRRFKIRDLRFEFKWKTEETRSQQLSRAGRGKGPNGNYVSSQGEAESGKNPSRQQDPWSCSPRHL